MSVYGHNTFDIVNLSFLTLVREVYFQFGFSYSKLGNNSVKLLWAYSTIPTPSVPSASHLQIQILCVEETYPVCTTNDLLHPVNVRSITLVGNRHVIHFTKLKPAMSTQTMKHSKLFTHFTDRHTFCICLKLKLYMQQVHEFSPHYYAYIHATWRIFSSSINEILTHETINIDMVMKTDTMNVSLWTLEWNRWIWIAYTQSPSNRKFEIELYGNGLFANYRANDVIWKKIP